MAEELLEKNRREGLAETTLSKKAWLLTSTLIVIDITLAGLFWAPSENADVIASLIKKVLYVGFVAFLSEVIFESFAGLGLTAGSSLITADDLMRPGYIAGVGFQAALPLLEEAGGLMGPIPDRTPAKLTLALNPENRTRSLRPGSEGSGDRIALVACS
ncbi:MAG: hypothetical protein CVT79_00485 [Alphaproteobacteria bacterium HGW-Alphaproteobacteria-18]|nr:MAG: hypothetical protein CVT79_00485 [Alphaproteobacteria bacterium HGW-Alphaproteobacteria-18]